MYILWGLKIEGNSSKGKFQAFALIAPRAPCCPFLFFNSLHKAILTEALSEHLSEDATPHLSLTPSCFDSFVPASLSSVRDLFIYNITHVSSLKTLSLFVCSSLYCQCQKESQGCGLHAINMLA